MKSIEEIREIARSWDEPKSICTCGHLGDGPKSAHKDLRAAIGHGPCIFCPDCKQFTWKRYTLDFAEATK